jgi:polar amino acid transport system substrate-binding protein
MTRTRTALAAALTAVALLATAACSESAPPAPAPLFEPTEAPSAGPPAAVDTSCNPRVSLRPPAGALPAPERMPTGSYMAEIWRKDRLILGTSQDTLLFSSRNPFTGKVEGFDVDMARQIAKVIFGDPDKVQIKVVPRSERTAWVRDGKVDLIISTMTANCARWREVDFSTTYFKAGQRVMVGTDSTAESLDDLGGKRVCAAAGSTSLENIAAAESKPIAVSRAGFGDCLVAFQQNEVDAVSTDDTILAGLAAQDPYAKVVGPRFTEEPYGMAMNNDHPEFTRFVNQVLDQMRRDGTWAATYTKWLKAPAPQPPAAQYR